MGASMELTSQSGETPKDVARRFAQLACLKILGGDADKSETGQRRHQNESATQGNRKKLTPKEEERQRARTKLDDLQKQFDVAKKNYRQLGGHLEEDQQREIIEQDSLKFDFSSNRKEYIVFFYFRKLDELQNQLEFERLKREKRESELDECRNEIVRLVNTLRSYEDRMGQAQVKFHFVFFSNYPNYLFSNDRQVEHMKKRPKNHHQLQINDIDV